MDTAPRSSQWKPNQAELLAADQLLSHLATRFPLTTCDRLREIAGTVGYARQILIEHGPAIAAPGQPSLGSLIVSALYTGHVTELELFHGLHPSASEAELLTLRPTLIADLDVADYALTRLTEALEMLSPPLAAK